MSRYLESNMEIYKNNQPIILTITGKKLDNSIINLMAFSNFGSQIHLSQGEKLRAESILLREENL